MGKTQNDFKCGKMYNRKRCCSSFNSKSLIKTKEIEMILRLFLVIAMYCQASSSQINESLNLPPC